MMDEISELLRSNPHLILFWKGVVLTASVYLLILGLSALAAPNLARRFLGGFAQGLLSNSVEAILRALVGLAFIGLSPEARFPFIVAVFGAFLVISALMMLFLSNLHRKFATKAVPFVDHILPLFGGLSIAFAFGLVWIFFV